MYTTKQKGFTIVELLIVIVVIAILAAISLVAFTGVQQRGRDSSRASDTSNIAKALTASTSEGVADWPADAEAARALLGNSNASVKVSNDISTKLTGTAASSSSTTTYGYTRCPATGTQTGAQITWLKEADDNAPQTVDAGSGC